MKPHPHIRKTVKWGGAVVTALLVVVWAWSGWFYLAWGVNQQLVADIKEGQVRFIQIHMIGLPGDPTVWRVERHPFQISWGFLFENNSIFRRWNVPLWPLCALSLASTAIAWRLDARARRNALVPRCPRCNYDRTGLPLLAGCPECGSGGVSA